MDEVRWERQYEAIPIVDRSIFGIELREPLQLLITDVVLSGLNRPELARAMAPLHPEMRVLYMSGYAESMAGVTDQLGAVAAFLRKPFLAVTLTQRVRQVLAAGT